LLEAGTVTGDVTYKRYVTGNATASPSTNWHLVSAPVTTQAINDFAVDAANAVSINGDKFAVAWYDNSLAVTTKWVYHETAEPITGGTFVNGEGYSTHRTIGGAGWDWTCVGNPYPSFLPIIGVFEANVDKLQVDHAALYLWDGSDYIPYNLSSVGDQLHPAQGFMVKSKSSSETFTFNESLQEI